ncbi:MAG: translocase, partial [Xanthomonadaceae bacterium]|nr:translocase [Xanthomonadaceae bacterium]
MRIRDSSATGERWTVALAAPAFFCVLAAYYVIRPVRDQLAGATGSVALPWFYAGTFVVTLAVAPLFGWLSARLPRRALLGWSYGFFIACLVAF